MRLAPSCASKSMSRLASSSPFARWASSSTIHRANPMALSIVNPWSSMRFRRSFNEPPLFLYSLSLPSHGSIPV